MSYLQLAEEGKLQELEELLTKGTKEQFLVEEVHQERWIPLPVQERKRICGALLLFGLKKGKEDIVKLAKSHGAEVDNDLLCAIASGKDEKLFREIVSQMGEEKVDWKRIISNILCTEDSLHFFQHLVDHYLPFTWEKFLPDREDISDDADAYIALLRRFNRVTRTKAPKSQQSCKCCPPPCHREREREQCIVG